MLNKVVFRRALSSTKDYNIFLINRDYCLLKLKFNRLSDESIE